MKSGDIIVATLNGNFVCKIADIKGKKLISSAPGSHAYQLKEGDDFIVEGVVTRSIRLHRPLTRGLS